MVEIKFFYVTDSHSINQNRAKRHTTQYNTTHSPNINLSSLQLSSNSPYIHTFHSLPLLILLSMRLVEIKGEEEEEEETMRNSIRCCISCILPCGALDVIRIVHCNGRVEEISGSIKASEIMKTYPKHVLKKPSSPSTQDGGVVPKIVVVPPDADLQRGKIYFLMPLPSPPPLDKNNHRHSKNSSVRKKRKEQNERILTNNYRSNGNSNSNNNIENSATLVMSSDQYLTEILSEKVCSQRDRRRGRVAVWRPHLESISESPTNHL